MSRAVSGSDSFAMIPDRCKMRHKEWFGVSAMEHGWGLGRSFIITI